jgi:HEAT repeat protein
MRLRLQRSCANSIIAIAAALTVSLKAPAADSLEIPDFTQGQAIPAGSKHDWNLGPTGLRGWIFSDKMVTSDARQIAVTKVESGSPAEGVLAVGDVLLGAGGKRFSHDPRTELGRSITVAESAEGGGKLMLTRWRAGETGDVVVKLPVLGSYSRTAPFDCEKSQRVLEQGCKALAKKVAQSEHGDDEIVRSLNALALLASGDAAYLPLVKSEAQWAAGFKSDSMQTWHYGYVMILLAEYVIATSDQSVMPGLQRLALEAARGQSAVGSWGHGFAIADGRLGGYGMMNSPGVPLTIGLVLAREAGVKEAAVDLAIESSAKLLRFYAGKGAIPYGDHHPWIESHEDNGKCGMAAVLFTLLGETKPAEFFSRMSLASHGSERDTGHTGNFFNMLWAMPGVALSGPEATGAWMQEFGGWYFDLARRWDGTFIHQGPPEPEPDSYHGWDGTGGYLLACAMPLRKIRLTGKIPGIVPRLDAPAAQSLIADGRGWNNKDRTSAYDALSGEQLIERLGSWSPVVRERAAMALARREETPVPAILQLLDSPRLESRYGACQAIAALQKRGAPAVEPLRKLLTEPDLWLRIKAADALAAIGAPARQAVPQLLELLAQVDPLNDPRAMQQRYLSFALFADREGILSRSLDGVDRAALYKAVRAGLKNQDGRARGSIGSVYLNLSSEDIKPLLPAIYQAVIEPAPSGEMFADAIRVEGLRLLAKHGIEEGIAACVKYTRDQNPWDSQERTPELMKILLSYGTHAQAVIPELKKISDYFAEDEKDFPRHLMAVKAKSVRETIRAIEAATDAPPLTRLHSREAH